ncbi:hypothetical protein ACOI1C_08585 [Bacillus sp. DJP31]|uniref:hypothetical protein n=1 Tax=Bacillus sp. DJP31 TaxID=3409789 RepID=UPI003BB61F48
MNFSSIHTLNKPAHLSLLSQEDLFIQLSIDQIIKGYYSEPVHLQNNVKLLAHIHQSTRRKVFLESPSLLAILTNHLLSYITKEAQNLSFTMAPSKAIFIPELKGFLSVQFEVGEWTNETFKLKKYIWKETNLQLLVDIVTIYANNAYISMPEAFDVFDMQIGKKIDFKLAEVSSALARVKLVISQSKNKILQGTFYSFHL